MRAVSLTVAELGRSAGRDLGASPWRIVSAERCTAYAKATHASGATMTNDVPPLLLLSLVPGMILDLLQVTDRVRGLNYGVSDVRFLQPVAVGARVRLVARIEETEWRQDGGLLYALDTRVEVEDGDLALQATSMLVTYGQPSA